jgi:alpha-1,3-rhamnosyl/mannosyltransferase
VRIAVNHLAALDNTKTGIGHYTTELVRCLVEQTPPGTITCFPPPWVSRFRRVWRKLRGAAGGGPAPAGAAPRGPSRWRRRLGHLAERLRIGVMAWASRGLLRRCDLHHEPNFIPLPGDCPTVATFHDLSAVLHPEWHPAARVAFFERHLPRALNQCCHFLTISEFSRQQIVRHLGVPATRVSVTYMGVRPGLRPLPPEETAAALRRLGLPPAYLLHVGTLEPRKNLETLIRAYAGLPAALRSRWPLLLVGRWGWNAAGLMRCLDEVGKPAGVLHLGYVAEEDLAALYNGARALAFPTHYEGFGMPAIEMLACGGAVLASTAAALAETAGHKAHLIDPDDEPGWRDGLRGVLTDDDWHRDLCRGAVAAAAPFTWARCATDTLRAYRAALGASEPEPISWAA